jgi:RHS repeat-associated protein
VDRSQHGKVVRNLNAHEAVVQNAHGRKSIAKSLLPIDGRTPSGKKAPVDLNLIDRGGSLVPESTLVPVTLPVSTEGLIDFPKGHFGLRLGADAPVDGVHLGGSVFFPNLGGARHDTDAVVRPLPLGAEVSYLLRSEASPQSQMLSFDLPAGWTLHDPADHSGSIQVKSPAGTIEATVLPPVAIDAQGQTVPVRYSLKSATQLVVHVSHRGGDFAYPILVDPSVDFPSTTVGSEWSQVSNDSSGFSTLVAGGVSAWKMHPGTAYSAGQLGDYKLGAPSGAYIYGLSESGIGHNAIQSLEYGGIMNSSGGWEPGTWQNETDGSSGGGADHFAGGSLSNTTYKYCARSGCISGPSSGIAAGNSAVFGLQAWTNFTQPSNTNASDSLTDATVYLADSVIPTLAPVTHDGYTPGKWVYNAGDDVEVDASASTGLGILQTNIGGGLPVQTASAGCSVVCPLGVDSDFFYDTSSLPEGTTWGQVTGTGAGGNVSNVSLAGATWPINIDRTPPAITATLTDPSGNNVPTNGDVREGNYTFQVSATDSSASHTTSGATQINLLMDGSQVAGFPHSQSCAAGGCSMNANWALNPSDYGEGTHTITIIAADQAGNTSQQSFPIKVHHSDSGTLGPGSLNLKTGEFSLPSTDVSIDGFGEDLTFARTYNSEHLTGTPGPFGPQWQSSLPVGQAGGDFQSVQSNPDGSAILTDSFGDTIEFAPGLASPPGFEDIKLATGSGQPTNCPGLPTGPYYTLTDGQSDVTVFMQPGGAGATYVPVCQVQPGAANHVTYTFDSQNRPTLAIAPAPAGVTCTPSTATTTDGCRTLSFIYATTTTATTTVPGDFAGRLSQVSFAAWDPATSAMHTVQVAQYQYDALGRLVAEWDPRVSPALKMTYAYDTAGHVTTMTPPGQAAWTFNYGTISGDINPGRLVSLSRPDPVNGTATSTISYNVPLTGAAAPYAMGSSDVAGWGQTDVPATATAIFPPDEVPAGSPPANYTRATIYYLDTLGREVNVADPGGRISTTEYDASNSIYAAPAGEHDLMTRTLSPADRATALSSGASSAAQAKLLDTEYSYASNAIDTTEELGPQHAVQLQNGTQVQARRDTKYSYGDTSATAIHLPTQVSVGVLASGQTTDTDVRTTTTAYDDTLGKPTKVTNDAGGLNVVHTTAYDDTTGNVLKAIQPANTTGADAHETDTVYYSAGANATVPACGGHPEFANLPCQTQPAAQPTGTTAPPSFVQSATAHATSVASLAVSPTSAITAGNRIIVEVGIWKSTSATASKVTDSTGNTYTELLHFAASDHTEMSIWSAPVTAGGGTRPTITVTPTSKADVGIAALEYAGLSAASGTGALDVQAHASGLTTAAAAVASGATAATSAGNELAIGFYVDSGFGDTLTAGTGLTQRANVSATPDMEFVAEDQTVAGGATPSSTVKTGANTTWLMSTLVFKTPAALPNIPVTSYTYNILDEPTVTAATASGKTRTTTVAYDAAGREVNNAVTSTAGDAVPSVTYGYDPTSGLETSLTASDARKLTTVYDSLGRITSYTDADGNTSTYTYDIDGRQKSVNDGKGSQTDSYDAVSGDLASIQDSAAGTFTAGYNADGDLTTQSYPNGMSANYAYDETGTRVRITYVKTANCTANCTWYDEQIRESIYGQQLHDQSTLGTRDFAYDGVGRLTQTQDTPTGKGCTTRVYAYDADSNRLSLTTRAPGTNGVCATSGGAIANHTYDAADRLTDGGVTYDAMGNTLTLPAADAGGTTLTSTYYANDRLHTQSQNGETLTYNLDPGGRVRERMGSGTTTGDTIDHFSDPSDIPAWSVNGTSWTRNIQGIDGELDAIQTSTPGVTIELTNLHGDVIGTVADSATATSAALKQDTDEFGVPTVGATPQRFDYLGGQRRTTALPSGVIDMGEREYVPELGRFLQTDPDPGGSANAYDYAGQDPVNGTDLEGTKPIKHKILEAKNHSGYDGGENAGHIFLAGSALKTNRRPAQTLRITVEVFRIDKNGNKAPIAELWLNCHGATSCQVDGDDGHGQHAVSIGPKSDDQYDVVATATWYKNGKPVLSDSDSKTFGFQNGELVYESDSHVVPDPII